MSKTKSIHNRLSDLQVLSDSIGKIELIHYALGSDHHFPGMPDLRRDVWQAREILLSVVEKAKKHRDKEFFDMQSILMDWKSK